MHKQSGVALMESLVSLVVLSIGLLGMAGLLLHSMKSMGKAQYEAQAVYAANLAGSALFSEASVAQASHDLSLLVSLNGRTTSSLPDASATSFGQALQEWSQYTQSNLPNGLGAIAVTEAGGNGACTALPCLVAITMSWIGSDHIPQMYETSMMVGY